MDCAGSDMTPGGGIRPSGDSDQFREALDVWRLAVKDIPPGDTCRQWAPEALCAWQYTSPARWSRSVGRLAPREQRQTIMLQQDGVMLALWCVVYNVSRISRRSTCWCSLSCGSKRIP